MTSRKYSNIRIVLCCLVAFVPQPHPRLAGEQSELGHLPVVSFPFTSDRRVPSPNKKWVLVFECPKNCLERLLSIEDDVSHTKRLVAKYERNLDVSWSPDGTRFFVTDDYGSDGSLSYVYDAISLKRTDLAHLLVASDPDAAKFLKAGHAYLRATQWLGPQELLVFLAGHFDKPPRGVFSFQYRINLNGRVERLPVNAAR
jgi:hypothetical protein